MRKRIRVWSRELRRWFGMRKFRDIMGSDELETWYHQTIYRDNRFGWFMVISQGDNKSRYFIEMIPEDESLPVTSNRNRKSRCCSCHCWMLYCRSDRGERPSPAWTLARTASNPGVCAAPRHPKHGHSINRVFHSGAAGSVTLKRW